MRGWAYACLWVVNSFLIVPVFIQSVLEGIQGRGVNNSGWETIPEGKGSIDECVLADGCPAVLRVDREVVMAGARPDILVASESHEVSQFLVVYI